MSSKQHQIAHSVDTTSLGIPLESEVDFKINSDSRLSSVERPELVVTLPRYSPSSDVTTGLDTEPTDQETLCRALDSPSDGAMALLEERGDSSSLQSETSYLTQNLVNLFYIWLRKLTIN